MTTPCIRRLAPLPVCALLVALVPLAPAAAEDFAVIRPAPAGQPVVVQQQRSNENIRVINDTQLYMSAQIIAAGPTPRVLQDHVKSVSPANLDPHVIPPQSGVWNGLYSSSETDFDQPQGRNAMVIIVTAGRNARHLLKTDEERDLHTRLLMRTTADQCIIPLLTSLSGTSFLGNSTKLKVLQAAISEALGQNHQFVENLQAAADSGSPRALLSVAGNWLAHELEAGGPIVGLIRELFGVKIREVIARKLAASALKKFIPGANVLDVIMQVANWGPTGVTVLNYAHDVIGTPSRLIFSVYFRVGVTTIRPTTVRTDRDDTVFEIDGYRLDDPGLVPTVQFLDRNGNVIATRQPFEVTPGGGMMRVRLPAAVLAMQERYLTSRVQLGRELHVLPERINLINVMRIDALEPSQGRPGQQVRVVGSDLYPFTFANRVYVGTADGRVKERAEVVVAGNDYLTVTVPSLAEDPKDLLVWVEERYAGKRKESNKLAFVRLPGTRAEAEAAETNALMAERDFEITGTLTAAEPASVTPVMVPAGMQIEATLVSLDGVPGADPRVALSHWGLTIYTRNADGPVRQWVARQAGPISQRQPGQVVQHTGEGARGARLYYVQLHRGSGQSVIFKVRVRVTRRGDLGGAYDAGPSATQALELPIGLGPQVCHLYGEPHDAWTDRYDWYRISGVPANQRLDITIHSIGDAATRDTSQLASVVLYRVRNGNLEEHAKSPLNAGMNDTPFTLRQDDTTSRDLLLRIEHGRGLVTYRLSASVHHIAGPDLERTPVTSFFNQGTVEGWTISGNYTTTPVEPEYATFGYGNGYIRGKDTGEQTGALDLVFAIDTTGSMQGAIDSVKQSAAAIIRELQLRSPSLRVGLVAFKDKAGDGASARSVSVLTTDVQARLAELSAFGASGGGGDGPEDALYGLQGALDMQWRAQTDTGAAVARAIILITDAPFKLDGSGADADGRTISTVAAAARAAGIHIYPLPIGSNTTLADHARSLAFGAGGEVLSASDASKVAEKIVGIVAFAVDRASPRYFTAPAKFLGDVSRFYGRALQFDLRGAPGQRRFSAPDIVLEGGDRTLTMQTLIVPGEADVPRAPNRGFQRYVIALSDRTDWRVSTTGQRATREDIMAVLGNLRRLSIRGEFFAGPDECGLDHVILGSDAAPTDAGLSDPEMMWLEEVAARARLIGRYEELVRNELKSPANLLQKSYADAGMPDADAARAAAIDAYTLSSAFTSGSRSPVTLIYAAEQDRLQRLIDGFRASGRITRTQAQRVGQGVREWDRRNQLVRDTQKAMIAGLTTKALADYRMFKGDFQNQQRQSELKSGAEEALRRLEQALKDATATPAFSTAGE
ncbi:MAG: laminin B domain-containing protein [Planctomycetota bacterium]